MHFPPERHYAPILQVIGQHVRVLRNHRKWSRKDLAQAAKVSERHLASLETGTGNVSILILLQVSQALDCEITDLLSDFNLSHPLLKAINHMLMVKSEAELKVVHDYLDSLFQAKSHLSQQKIALVGLRGAGKSTLGQQIALELNLNFVELSRVVERIAGCQTNEIHSLYGASAYQRYQRLALEETLDRNDPLLIATTGGLVLDGLAWEKLHARCLTIWLQAKPEDHLSRVMAQGDMRPMAGSTQALQDLKHILNERTPFYAKAHQSFNTSEMSVKECVDQLTHRLKFALKLA
jgi:XRE family aerobic/anaerobic benzoate catabolism transcriptional regulator